MHRQLLVQEVLLHRRLDRLEPPAHLLVVRVQLLLHLTPLTLQVLPVREQLVDAVALAGVGALELAALVENVVDVLVDPVAVEHQVVVGELALEIAHLVGELLAYPLELAVVAVVLLRLVDVALERADLRLHLGALGVQLLDVVRVVVDLPRRPVARGAHPAKALLRRRALGDVHLRVHADARRVDRPRARGALPAAERGARARPGPHARAHPNPSGAGRHLTGRHLAWRHLAGDAAPRARARATAARGHRRTTAS
eukprot:scaffold14854_cov53-Phaeocystis_antarctica.AAC.2